jgi:hypothetical protein
MTFIDRSPGGVIIAANTLLYATVLTEVWMLTTASLAAMAAVMTLIIVMAALLCRYMMTLMGTEEYLAGEAPAPAPVAAQAPSAAAPAVTAPRRPAPAVTATPVLR